MKPRATETNLSYQEQTLADMLESIEFNNTDELLSIMDRNSKGNGSSKNLLMTQNFYDFKNVLHYAIRKSNSKIIREIIKFCSDKKIISTLNKSDEDGCTPLHRIAQRQDLETFKFLYDTGMVSKDRVDKIGKYASKYLSEELYQDLIKEYPKSRFRGKDVFDKLANRVKRLSDSLYRHINSNKKGLVTNNNLKTTDKINNQEKTNNSMTSL